MTRRNKIGSLSVGLFTCATLAAGCTSSNDGRAVSPSALIDSTRRLTQLDSFTSVDASPPRVAWAADLVMERLGYFPGNWNDFTTNTEAARSFARPEPSEGLTVKILRLAITRQSSQNSMLTWSDTPEVVAFRLTDLIKQVIATDGLPKSNEPVELSSSLELSDIDDLVRPIFSRHGWRSAARRRNEDAAECYAVSDDLEMIKVDPIDAVDFEGVVVTTSLGPAAQAAFMQEMTAAVRAAEAVQAAKVAADAAAEEAWKKKQAEETK